MPSFNYATIGTAVTSALPHAGALTITRLGAGFAAIATAEMAIRAVGNLCATNDNERMEKFSKNLGGAVFYGTLACNIIPGSAAFAGVILGIYTLGNMGRPDSYCFVQAANLAKDAVVVPAWRAVSNIVEAIWNAVGDTLIAVGNFLGKVIGAIIPRDPIWIGVNALFVAIIIYKGPTQIFQAMKNLA